MTWDTYELIDFNKKGRDEKPVFQILKKNVRGGFEGDKFI